VSVHRAHSPLSSSSSLLPVAEKHRKLGEIEASSAAKPSPSVTSTADASTADKGAVLKAINPDGQALTRLPLAVVLNTDQRSSPKLTEAGLRAESEPETTASPDAQR
jgi:hypothetical protein